MCDWEEFLFECGHSTVRLKSYCHFARNDPNHQCLGVKVLRESWKQDGQLCDSCVSEGYRFDAGSRSIWLLSGGRPSSYDNRNEHLQQRRHRRLLRNKRSVSPDGSKTNDRGFVMNI